MGERINIWDLVIVGSGPGSLVLALKMAEKGFRVAILERQPSSISPSRGEIIQPNGLRVLEEIGLLADLLKADVYRNEQVYFHEAAGPRLCAIDYKALPPPYPYALILLPQVLQKALLDRIASFSNIKVYWGVAFLSLLYDQQQVIGLEAERHGEKMTFHASMVVGADGARSAVRSASGIRSKVHVYSDAYLTMVVERPPGFRTESYYYLGRRSIFGFFPISQKKCYFFYMVPSGSFDSIRACGLEHFKEEILSLNPDVRSLMEISLKSISSWDTVSYMPCFKVSCDVWTGSGLALLGDAAHAMNPHVAQGRNSAMEDGLALASVIENCFKKKDFSRQMLLSYESTRRPSIEVLQRMGDEMNLFWNSGFPPLVWCRERFFRSLQGNRRLHNKILMTIAGLQVEPLNNSDRLRAILYSRNNN